MGQHWLTLNSAQSLRRLSTATSQPSSSAGIQRSAKAVHTYRLSSSWSWTSVAHPRRCSLVAPMEPIPFNVQRSTRPMPHPYLICAQAFRPHRYLPLLGTSSIVVSVFHTTRSGRSLCTTVFSAHRSPLFGTASSTFCHPSKRQFCAATAERILCARVICKTATHRFSVDNELHSNL